jgi:hypothetical protein
MEPQIGIAAGDREIILDARNRQWVNFENANFGGAAVETEAKRHNRSSRTRQISTDFQTACICLF